MLPVTRRSIGAVGLAAVALTAASRAKRRIQRRSLQTAEHVDLERYLGTWFEIARLPVRFERGCVGTTATYTRLPDGHIEVVNRCHRGSCRGRVSEIRGTARVADKQSNAKLKVYFYGPFGGDYWILDVGPNYGYALVGTPNRKMLWILGRSPVMGPDVYQRLVEKAREQGFPVSRLVRTESCEMPFH